MIHDPAKPPTPETDAVDPAFVEALERLKAAPEGHPHAAHEVGFNTACAIACYTTSGWLLEQLPAARELPYAIVDQAISGLSEYSLRWGAKIFAALSRNPSAAPAPDPPAIGFSELWAAFSEAVDENSEVGRAWIAANGQVDQLEQVLLMSAVETIHQVMKLHPLFADHEELLGSYALEHQWRGAAHEFCLTRLLAETREGESFLPKIVAAVTGNDDLTDEANVAAFESTVGMPDTVLPWPLDQQCLCGKSLKPFIFCCDPRRPFDMKEYEADLGPTFVLERPCCRQHFEGFRCDACGRVYSWFQAVVPTLSQRTLM